MARPKPISEEELRLWRSIGLDPKALGEALRMKRVALGLNIKQAAEEIGCSAATVRNWERGSFDPNHVRFNNWVFESSEQVALAVWKQRALHAEATLRDIRDAMEAYSQVRADGKPTGHTH